jgi:hypothetical protein
MAWSVGGFETGGEAFRTRTVTTAKTSTNDQIQIRRERGGVLIVV